jgi:hypothetical protein
MPLLSQASRPWKDSACPVSPSRTVQSAAELLRYEKCGTQRSFQRAGSLAGCTAPPRFLCWRPAMYSHVTLLLCSYDSHSRAPGECSALASDRSCMNHLLRQALHKFVPLTDEDNFPELLTECHGPTARVPCVLLATHAQQR